MDVDSFRKIILAEVQSHDLEAVLQKIVRGLADNSDVALTRIWLIAPGDICASCRMQSVCPEQTHCLHLVASAGNPLIEPRAESGGQEDWARINGHFRRIPLNTPFKLSHIATTGAPIHIRIQDGGREQLWLPRADWVKAQKIKSFVGLPVTFQGKVLGVLAVFSRVELSEREFGWLRGFADHAAAAISKAQATEQVIALRTSVTALEGRWRSVFEKSAIGVAFSDVTGHDQDCIAYDPSSQRVFTFNGRSDNSTAIDAKTLQVVGTISLGGKPEYAVPNGRGMIYNNLEDKSVELAIDSHTLKIQSRWPMAPCEHPSGLAIDAEHNVLFAGCHNKLMAIIDANTGKVITTAPIGAGVDANRFDPETGLAFSSNGAGTLTVVKEESPRDFKEVRNVATERGARTMEFDPRTHNVFLVTARFAPSQTAPGGHRGFHRPELVPFAWDKASVLSAGFGRISRSADYSQWASAEAASDVPGGGSPDQPGKSGGCQAVGLNAGIDRSLSLTASRRKNARRVGKRASAL